jgi:phosphomannomutase
LYDSKGEFVDSHHIILLLIKYLVEVKKYSGKVVVAFSVTPRFKKLCAHFGLDYEITKIGFKYIAGHMITEDVLLGGEESGGIAIKGHIPERDGIWMGLTLWEYMAREGKTLEALIADLYQIVGAFQYERDDLHITEALKQSILVNCNNRSYQAFGEFKVINLETIDGFKYYFENDEWLMIRASGTEPVLRLYAETGNANRTRALLEAAKAVLLQ